MSQKKPYSVILSGVIFSIMVLSFFPCNNSLAEEKKNVAHMHIINVSSISENSSSNNVTIKKGDTVLWYNQDNDNIIINFLSPMNYVCSPLINFNADEHGYYTTDKIPRGGTASLCFVKKGEYDFEVKKMVEWKNKVLGEKTFSAKIIVHE